MANSPRYLNTPTVVVVLVPLRGGLLMIRRALAGEGYGKLALPGGFQMLGQTWQEAGAREVLEETGVVVEPTCCGFSPLRPHQIAGRTSSSAGVPPVEHPGGFVHDSEVAEVLVIFEPVETAFPLHTRMVRAFFEKS